ncbi:MAG: hemolysin XhlA family protein [Tenericutes bacterium]|nr:hemolysin XhlA family protein [Mycoplasmatota bacterium]
MEIDKFQKEIIERLAIIETLLKDQDYKVVKQTADAANNRSINNETRISKLEDSSKWLIRLVLGALVLGILAFIYGM